MPFIEEILNNTQSIICDLQPQQVTLFFHQVLAKKLKPFQYASLNSLLKNLNTS